MNLVLKVLYFRFEFLLKYIDCAIRVGKLFDHFRLKYIKLIIIELKKKKLYRSYFTDLVDK